MLAQPTTKPPTRGSWVYERKLDGQRVIGIHDGHQTRLFSRTHREINDTYPELHQALHEQATKPCIVDGEVVALTQEGTTSFSLLQRRMHRTRRRPDTPIPVAWLLFDVLHIDGYSTREIPLTHRKPLLEHTVPARSPLATLAHTTGPSTDLLQNACEQGWEGLIAKRSHSRYRSKRSSDWLKLKCIREQEFVVGGYTDPQGSRTGFGALLLGYNDEEGTLTYVGKVGTGFDDALLEALTPLLERLEQLHPPFQAGDPPRRAHWVRPRLVAEIAYAEWTPDDRLRHPRFKGLRTDKDPHEITKEPGPALPDVDRSNA